jgi:pseudouridine synthase
VITSHSSADALPSHHGIQRRTVYEDIFSIDGFVGSKGILPRSKLHAIGRLDADTTGLLLLTNDGGLVHHVTNPNSTASIQKTYEAIIMGHWNDTSPAIEGMKQHGVDIGIKYGGWTRPPVSLVILDHPTPKSTRVEITLSEGKNRQVRRMFHAIQSGAIKLQRTRIGHALTCGGLKQGQWRIFTDQEVETHLNWKPRRIKNSSVNHGGGVRRRKRSNRGHNDLPGRHGKQRKQPSR